MRPILAIMLALLFDTCLQWPSKAWAARPFHLDPDPPSLFAGDSGCKLRAPLSSSKGNDMKILRFSNWMQSALIASLTTTLAAVMVLTPQTALAHAVLLKAVPAANSTVTGPDIAMMFQFNSRVDGARSQISVVDESGKAETLALDKQKTLDMLTAHASHLVPGRYAIHWQVLSVDGHITRGQIAFEVK